MLYHTWDPTQMDSVNALSDLTSKKHCTLMCLMPSDDHVSYRERVQELIGMYDQYVHQAHMSLFGLSSNEKNWEQIEAHNRDVKLLKEVEDFPSHQVLRRTIFRVGEERKIVKVVDLARFS